MKLNYKKLNNFKNVYLSAGGYTINLCAATDTVIDPCMVGFIPTGLSIDLPLGSVGYISVALDVLANKLLSVFSMMITPEDREEIIIPVMNISNENKLFITAGEAFAKMRLVAAGHMEI